MLSNYMFLVLGVFDAFAVILLALSINMQPISEYKNSILFICVWSTMISFIVRIVIDVPTIDIPLQVISFTLFFRYIMQYKYWDALLLTAFGLTAYTAITLTVAGLLKVSGVIDSSAFTDSEGLGVSSIQATTILFAYLICALLKYLNIGFSFIDRPPHNFKLKEAHSVIFTLVIVASLIVISLTLITIIHTQTLWIFPFALLTFALLFIYSYRRNKEL